MNWQVTLIFVLVTVLYAVIGGIIFHFLENDFEAEMHSEVLAEFDGLCKLEQFALSQSVVSGLLIFGLPIDWVCTGHQWPAQPPNSKQASPRWTATLPHMARLIFYGPPT